MRVGTAHFLSYAAAVRYHRAQHGDNACIVVPQKLRAGEIHIGRPIIKNGERLQLIDDGTRWAIESST
jgi:hypothetical protein